MPALRTVRFGTRPEVRLASVRRSRRNGVTRVEADVLGEPLWFASRTELDDGADAFVCALLPAIAARGLRLRVDAPVDPVLRGQVDDLTAIWAAWWGHRPAALAWGADRPPGTRADAAGLCFTGGVDSFHALLRSPEPVSALVAAEGYDVRLGWPRQATVERHLRAVADARGVPLHVVRSNLRDHPIHRGVPWEHAFGGALAAVGHALAPHLGTLRIASSFPEDFPVPYGQHVRTDPLWSSSRLQVVPGRSALWRCDKLRELTAEPLVRAHLLVCWADPHAPGNCSACEKCVRTMLTLAQAGALEDFPTFSREIPLAARLDALPEVRHMVRAFEVELGRGLPTDLARATRALVARSGGGPRALLPALARRARRVLDRGRTS